MRPLKNQSAVARKTVNPVLLTALRRKAFRQGGWRCPESEQKIRGLPHQRKTFDRCCSCVDSPGAAVFSSYLFKTITSGEIGFDAGAEGATAPETLRQTDPRDLTASGKRHRRALPGCVRRRDNTLRHSDRWGFL